MSTIRERFSATGASVDSFNATIGAVTKNGSWYTFVATVITTNNKLEPFLCKLNAGSNKEEYIKTCSDFFEAFTPGDYLLTNVVIRVAGETWDDGTNSGTYKESYISVPFISNILALGKDAIIDTKRKEAELAKIAWQALQLNDED